jgi:hypothetical protein
MLAWGYIAGNAARRVLLADPTAGGAAEALGVNIGLYLIVTFAKQLLNMFENLV